VTNVNKGQAKENYVGHKGYAHPWSCFSIVSSLKANGDVMGLTEAYTKESVWW